MKCQTAEVKAARSSPCHVSLDRFPHFLAFGVALKQMMDALRTIAPSDIAHCQVIHRVEVQPVYIRTMWQAESLWIAAASYSHSAHSTDRLRTVWTSDLPRTPTVSPHLAATHDLFGNDMH